LMPPVDLLDLMVIHPLRIHVSSSDRDSCSCVLSAHGSRL
jgi:hypothetical protein